MRKSRDKLKRKWDDTMCEASNHPALPFCQHSGKDCSPRDFPCPSWIQSLQQKHGSGMQQTHGLDLNLQNSTQFESSHLFPTMRSNLSLKEPGERELRHWHEGLLTGLRWWFQCPPSWFLVLLLPSDGNLWESFLDSLNLSKRGITIL